MKELFKRLLASHKTTVTAITGAVTTAGASAIATQIQTGHVDLKAVGYTALAAGFAVLGGLAKSPLTPKADPPAPDDPQ